MYMDKSDRLLALRVWNIYILFFVPEPYSSVIIKYSPLFCTKNPNVTKLKGFTISTEQLREADKGDPPGTSWRDSLDNSIYNPIVQFKDFLHPKFRER